VFLSEVVTLNDDGSVVFDWPGITKLAQESPVGGDQGSDICKLLVAAIAGLKPQSPDPETPQC
jgi:hypothetical protein